MQLDFPGASVDVLYSYLNGRFRLLGEYELELERFQLGWQGGEKSTGWLGRFHRPSRHWNTIYHHGQFLQTTISRPFLEQFEDHGGVVPTHSTGLLFETAHQLETTADLRAAVSFGAAPVIDRTELKPFDPYSPRLEQQGGRRHAARLFAEPEGNATGIPWAENYCHFRWGRC